jgi:hypothetical protein
MRVQLALFVLFMSAMLSGCKDNASSVTTGKSDTVTTERSKLPTHAVEEVVANDNCGINAPTPGSEVDRSKSVSIWGYAMNKKDWTLPDPVTIRISSLHGNERIVLPAKRSARKDVADAFDRPEIENSGFGVEADLSALPAGAYMVSVLQVIEGKTFVCNSALPINLK